LRLQKPQGKLDESPEFLNTFNLERLVLLSDSKKHQPPNLEMTITTIAKEKINLESKVFQRFEHFERCNTRLEFLQKTYPTFTLFQIKDIFSLYWSDDLMMSLFYTTNSSKGHVDLECFNVSLEPCLPIIEWFSGLDSKVLAGRALFERTFRERKKLITSLLKSKTYNSPARVILSVVDSVILSNGFVTVEIVVQVGNTSWMHEVLYEFETLKGGFSWAGKGRFIGKLDPLGAVSFSIFATFYAVGVYDVAHWKMKTKLAFPEIIEKRGVNNNKRVGAEFVQTPTESQLLSVIE
jgi:hypothetical protein